MYKMIKINDSVSVTFSNGKSIQREMSDAEFKEFLKCETEEEIIDFLYPKFKDIKEEKENVLSLIQEIENSKILKIKDNSIYWEDVSSLSIPQDLAKSIIEAENNNNELLLTTYKNFWTLMSLNSDEQCRKNLYWFLQLHGLRIAKCGFFVAYRNVVKTKTTGVYTDYHSHSTRIEIGNVVTMNRSDCDCNSNNECSRGLHCASAKWLKKNYFGDTGLACLVNPADVVAVPHNSEYGKLRTCAYLPMSIIQYNKTGNVIPLDVEDGFDCSYVTKVIYEGIMGTEKDSPYKIKIPEVPEINKDSIQDKLLDIAKDCIVNRQV